MTSQRLCFSRARWPMASKFCSRATSKSLLFHRNHMLGTLDFTRSEHWAPFIIFLRAQPCRLSVQILCKARKTGQSRGCYKIPHIFCLELLFSLIIKKLLNGLKLYFLVLVLLIMMTAFFGFFHKYCHSFLS